MNLFDKFKLATGFKSDVKEQSSDSNQYEISSEDTNDIIFAKNLIKNNGNFFYCDKENELIKTINALIENLKIESLYCREKLSKNY